MAKPWKEVGRYGSVGLEFVLTILISGAFGQWLDKRYWGDHGYGLAGFFLLGVGTAFRNLVRTANQMQADIEKAEARDPEAGHWKVDEGWLHPPPPVDRGPIDGDWQDERGDGDAKDGTKKARSDDDPER
ncbi:MAG: AtpZ/AtpI family protein [Polyangiaceae bacterium]